MVATANSAVSWSVLTDTHPVLAARFQPPYDRCSKGQSRRVVDGAFGVTVGQASNICVCRLKLRPNYVAFPVLQRPRVGGGPPVLPVVVLRANGSDFPGR